MLSSYGLLFYHLISCIINFFVNMCDLKKDNVHHQPVMYLY